MNERRIQLSTLIFAISLGFAVGFNNVLTMFSSAQYTQGENVPGFEIPIVITGLFLLVAFIVIRRRE